MTLAGCDIESCSSFGIKMWTDTAKLMNTVIAGFGDR